MLVPIFEQPLCSTLPHPCPFQKSAGNGGKRKMIASIASAAVQTFSRKEKS